MSVVYCVCTTCTLYRLSCVCVCAYYIYIWSDAAPQRDQFAEEAINHRAFSRLSLGSRHSIVYIIYTLTHEYMCTYDRPSAGIKIVQIYRARSVQVHRAALDLLRSVQVFGRSARIVCDCVHAYGCVYVCVCACVLYALWS